MENKKEKKKSSTIIKDAIALFLITLISGLALSYVFEITKLPIEEQQAQKKIEAFKAVYSDADSFIVDQALTDKAIETDLTSLDQKYKGITIDEVNQALNSNGELVGYTVKVTTTQSYKDQITLVAGYTKEGTITGIELLAISETAGLGAKASEPKFKDQFTNKAVEQFEVTKTGATADNQINAISGATITSRAVTYAVNAAIGFVKEFSTELGGGVK